MTRLKLLIALSSLGSLGLAGAALGSAAHPSTLVSTKRTSLGTILMNRSGQTLYLDSADKPRHFACTGVCLKTWPPLKAIGTVKAAGGAKASLLGTTTGPAGKTVTYNGHPLYTFISDNKRDPTSGEGQHGFYAVSPTGGKVTKATKTTTSTSTSTTTKKPGGQVPGY